MIEHDYYQKIEEISVKEWNNIFNNSSNSMQPLIFGYKLQIKNGEILYKQQKVNLVNRLLNKHIDKLYIESLRIKHIIKNTFMISVEGRIFVDNIHNNAGFDDMLLELGYIPIRRCTFNEATLSTYPEIKSYLYNSTNIPFNSQSAIFGFKIINKDKNTVISIRIKEKEKEKFVVNDLYKYYYNCITNFTAQEFKKYPIKYHNSLANLDERIIWLSVKLSLKILLLDSTFKDEHLKPIIKPFEGNINYDKLPEIIITDGLSSIFMIIISILYNKTIKSGFLESDLELTHKNIQEFIDESYCEHMYFVDNYETLKKLS